MAKKHTQPRQFFKLGLRGNNNIVPAVSLAYSGARLWPRNADRDFTIDGGKTQYRQIEKCLSQNSVTRQETFHCMRQNLTPRR